MTTEELAAMAAKAEEWSDPDADVGEDPMRFVDRVMAAFPSAVAESSALRSERDALRAERDRLKEALRECADAIQSDRDLIEAEFPGITRNPTPDSSRARLDAAESAARAALSPTPGAGLTSGSTVECGAKRTSNSAASAAPTNRKDDAR